MTTSLPEAPPDASVPIVERRTPPMQVVLGITMTSVALIGLAVFAVIGAVKLGDDHSRDEARAAAVAAARQEALNLTSIDGQNIDADLKRVQDGATGGFAKDFATRAKDLKSVLTDNAVVAEGRVIDAGLVRGDDNTATVLVVVDSTVKNKAAPAGRANTYRMQLDLERHGNRWLTSALQFVG